MIEQLASPPPSYLTPYLDASRQHGAGFGSLLWASQSSQATRFDALHRLYFFHNNSVLDAGCGRADLLDYLLDHKGVRPEHYFGLEAVDALADAAEQKRHPHCTILRADFVQEPIRLFVGADAVVFCGSLNTLDPETFYKTIRIAFDAAAEALLFNFLSSPRLAAAQFLTWHHPQDVCKFAATLTDDWQILDDYIDGDCTVILRHPSAD